MTGLRALLGSLALAGPVLGHVLDEYQQTALLTVEPDHIDLRLDLTPGVEAAPAVLGVIDADHDGVLSDTETRAYAGRVQRDLRVEVDGVPRALALTGCETPPAAALRTGEAAIRLDWRVDGAPLSEGSHRVAFQNVHWPALGTYTANAVQPSSPAVEVIRQLRGPFERSLQVDVRLTAQGRAAAVGAVLEKM